MRSNLTNIFLGLVQIDSPSGKERLICEYLQKRLSKLGIKTEVDQKGNLFAKTEGVGKPIILSAHMDTVEPGRGIRPVIENGIIKSDGSTILGADNKITLACILNAVEKVSHRKRKSLEIVFSVREETDGGISDFDFSKFEAKTGILADRSSPIGTICIASPWIENFELTVIGKGAHSGCPEEGINAITIASDSISELRWGRIDSETTANIGVIKGGSFMNAVPGEVFLQGEVRSFSKQKLNKRIIEIMRVFEKNTHKIGGLLRFANLNYCCGYEYKKTDNHILAIVDVMEKIGIKPKYDIAFGGSDANAFVKNGIKLVNIGDGVHNPHTVDEHVFVCDLEILGEIFINYIKLD